MSLMSKLLTVALIATVGVSADTNTTNVNPGVKLNKSLMKYVKRHVIKNRSVKVQDIKILEKREVAELKGWSVLLTNIDINYKDKNITVPEMMFLKDGIVAPALVNLKTGKNYRDEIRPNASDDLYNKEHLFYGNANAKHKIIIFSDPQCPFCQDIVPNMLKAGKNNPELFAIYYYHLPLLNIHPVSGVLTRAMHVAQQKGKLDVLEKFYAMKIKPREKDEAKIIAEIKKQTGFVVTKEEINAQSVKDALISDEKIASKMMVSGTPTIYLDGKWDKRRDGYEAFLPKPKPVSATANAPKTK